MVNLVRTGHVSSALGVQMRSAAFRLLVEIVFRDSDGYGDFGSIFGVFDYINQKSVR